MLLPPNAPNVVFCVILFVSAGVFCFVPVVLKILPAVVAPLLEPFVADAGVDVGADAAKGLPVPTLKLKALDGGCGLKVVFVSLLPNAGNEELEKMLFWVEGCEGGKLLAVPPNTVPFWVGREVVFPKRFVVDAFALLLSPPKVKPEPCDAAKGFGEATIPCAR